MDTIGRTAISMAAERGDVDAVTVLLEHGANHKIHSYSLTTPLHYAASAKEPDCIRLLLEAGTDVDCLTNWNQTPLIHAAAYIKDVRHAELLLDAGADFNRRDRDGITPLGWCTISNNTEVASALLRRGAEVANIDLYGSSPLQQCIKLNRHEILKLLVQTRPSLETSIPSNVSIWHLIAASSDVETMEILKQLDFTGFPIDDAHMSGISSPEDLLAERLDSSVELKGTFQALIQCVGHQSRDQGDSASQEARVHEPGGAQHEDSEDEDVWEDARETTEY